MSRMNWDRINKEATSKRSKEDVRLTNLQRQRNGKGPRKASVKMNNGLLPPTEKQLSYLRATEKRLGINLGTPSTRSAASQIIGKYHE